MIPEVHPAGTPSNPLRHAGLRWSQTTYDVRSDPNRPPLIPAIQNVKALETPRVAGRCGVGGGALVTPALYPALKSNLWVALRPGHFAERKRFRKSAGWWSNALRRGWCSAGLPASSSALLLRNFRGRIALRHNRAQRPQHRVLASRRCTDATQPAEWATNRPKRPNTGVPDFGV